MVWYSGLYIAFDPLAEEFDLLCRFNITIVARGPSCGSRGIALVLTLIPAACLLGAMSEECFELFGLGSFFSAVWIYPNITQPCTHFQV